MDSKTVVVAIAGLSGVALLSMLSRQSRSAAEIEPLAAFDPESTFVGSKRASNDAMWPGGPRELLAADGSIVRVGEGLSFDRGVLSLERPRMARALAPASRSTVRVGKEDVYLL